MIMCHTGLRGPTAGGRTLESIAFSPDVWRSLEKLADKRGMTGDIAGLIAEAIGLEEKIADAQPDRVLLEKRGRLQEVLLKPRNGRA
jgi:hypothetical protein